MAYKTLKALTNVQYMYFNLVAVTMLKDKLRHIKILGIYLSKVLFQTEEWLNQKGLEVFCTQSWPKLLQRKCGSKVKKLIGLQFKAYLAVCEWLFLGFKFITLRYFQV